MNRNIGLIVNRMASLFPPRRARGKAAAATTYRGERDETFREIVTVQLRFPG